MRDRWETPAGRLLADEVLARLAADRPLDGLGLGDVAGRTDLRGLPAPKPRRLTGVTLRGLDLSGASLGSFRFHQCVIEDCVVAKARCNDWRIWESQIRDTSFRGASFREAALGPWSDGKGNEFARVDFTRADFRGAAWITASYEDCDFSFARLDKMEFQRCGLVRCRFAGPLNEVIFDGRAYPGHEHEPNFCADVDMSAAVFRLTEFLGFNLAAVKLPDQPGLRVVENYPCVLAAVAEILGDRDDEVSELLRAGLGLPVSGLDHGLPFGLFNRRDYAAFGGEDLALRADELLSQAEQACGNAS